MTVSLSIQDFEDKIESGAYGGMRRLSASTELMLISLYIYESLYRWSNDNGAPLTDEQRDVVDLWTARAQDELMRSASVIGEFKYAAFASLNDFPDNWLLCNGSTVSAADYPDLLASCVFVTDDGSGGLILPNFQGRVARMFDPGNFVGTLSGANDVTLTIAQMPKHAHSLVKPIANTVVTVGSGAPVSVSQSSVLTSTAQTGSNGSHENRSASYNVQVFVVAR